MTYPTCQYETNSMQIIEAVFEEDKGLDDLPESILCGRRAFICQNFYWRNQTAAVRLLLPIVDPEGSPEYSWEHDHDSKAHLKRFRETVEGDHWRYLCPWHFVTSKWSSMWVAIEDYIERYIRRGFCWCAPWSQFKRLFVKKDDGRR